MDDEDEVQENNVATRGGWLQALWNKPLSAWVSAALLLAQTGVELVIQTAALLLAAAAIALRALTWRDEPGPVGR